MKLEYVFCSIKDIRVTAMLHQPPVTLKSVENAAAPLVQKEPTGEKRRAMANLLVPLLIVVVIGGLVTVSSSRWDMWTANADTQSTDNAYIRAEISKLSARVSGNVLSMTADDFQSVKAGELLVAIDPKDYQAKVDQAKATLDAAAAQLANLSNQEMLQQAAIQQAQAQLLVANTNAELAQQEADRQTSLLKSGSGTQQKSDQATSQARATSATTVASQASVNSAKAQLQVTSGQRDQLKANVDGAKAALDAAELNLSYTKIYAPFDGVVSERQVHIGDYVTTGANMVTLVPLPKVYVVANFKETQLMNMKPDQTVVLTVDALPGKQFNGHVTRIAPASGSQFALMPADNATGNFTKVVQRIPVRIDLDDNQADLDSLRPGMSSVASVAVRGN
jgi:membrane fusion protein, multidrug efflux system